MAVGDGYRDPAKCQHEWRQLWREVDRGANSVAVIPSGFFCIHCLYEDRSR